MQSYKCIDVAYTKKLMQREAVVFDIRDPESFSKGHIEGALHLSNDNIEQYISAVPLEQSIVVCCYHGVSSQQVARYFVDQV